MLIPALKGIGLEVYVKVLAPERSPIQTVLDFGADGVMIPHIQDLGHAREVTAYTKFPATGDRSLAGGRAMDYRMQPDTWFEDTNKRTRCFAMIETAGALRDVVEIAALPTVDGLFPGPTDLSLRRERGMYKRTDADWVDLETIAKAAKSQGKSLVFPAWSAEDRKLALDDLGASFVFSGHEMLFIGMAVANFAESLAAE